MLQNSNRSLNAKYSLHLRVFCPNHWDLANNRILNFARAAWLSKGLFLFPKRKQLRNLVFLPIKLIKQANQEGWFRSLAYFVRMKSLYVNNTHYNYNLRSLAKRLNCSPACLSHHLKELKSRGLVGDHSGNMTFKGYRKLGQIWGIKSIGVPVNHNNQLDLLRAQIIRFNLQQQEYNIKRSGVQLCQRNNVPNTFDERMNSCYAGLSAYGVGRILKVSRAQGAAIRSKLIQLRVLAFQRRFCRLFASGGPSGGGPADGFLNTMKRQGLVPTYSYIYKGYVIYQKRMELKYMAA